MVSRESIYRLPCGVDVVREVYYSDLFRHNRRLFNISLTIFSIKTETRHLGIQFWCEIGQTTLHKACCFTFEVLLRIQFAF